MSDANGLPPGWCDARIGDIVRLQNGFAFKPSHWKKTGLPIVRITNLNNPTAEFNYCPHDIPEKFRIKTGDLLFAWSGTPGTSFGAHIWRGGDAWLNQHIFRVDYNRSEFDDRFLRLAINWNMDEYIRQAHGGAGLAHITKSVFENSKIRLAPREEQRRIADKLDELFSDLDAGVAALERARANLKRYRAAVLKAAVEGKLTEQWRAEHPDIEPASQLLARILKERRAKWEADKLAEYERKGKQPPKGWQERYVESAPPDTAKLPQLPKGWCWASVAQVGTVQLGRQRSPKHHNGPHMRPYLRVANVFEDRINVSDVMEMNFTPEEFATYELRHGDILLNEGQSMELVGRPAMYRDEVPGSCFTNTLVRFQAANGVDPTFALRVFLAYLKIGRFQRIATITVNIAHLGAGRFAELEFPLPPVAEQLAMVSEIERLLSIAEAAELAIDHSLKRSSRLRQSVLAAAFEGQLVPQNSSDDPASALLDRIRSERAVTTSNGKSGQSRPALHRPAH